MRPKLHGSARFWVRFPSHWCHGIVRHGVTGISSWKAVLYHIDLFESSYIQVRRYLGGSPSCLVTLMVSDFGRVIYLT